MAGDYVVNARQQRLNLRLSWPPSSPESILLVLHGYGAHSNRPTFRALCEALVAEGIAVLSLDFHGHGYSQGERAFIESAVHLVDDALCALLALFAPKSGLACCVAHSASGIKHIFVMGHSLGGGTALVIANILASGPDAIGKTELFTSHEAVFVRDICPLFRGVLCLCPVSGGAVVPSLARPVVDSLLWLFPNSNIPARLMDENQTNHLVWASDEYRCYIEADGFPANPAGLSFGANMRFGTILSVLSLGDLVRATVTQATYPFMILHDPSDDVILPLDGSLAFVIEAPSSDKELVTVAGAWHDPLANKPVTVIRLLRGWILARV
jgi:alpha-beta hydrolase superfamily lysophospholipase